MVSCRYGATSTTSPRLYRYRFDRPVSTLAGSSEITRGGTPWLTHGATDPRLYAITSYTLPGTSMPWTKTGLDTAQIGVNLSTANTNQARVSTLWMLVEHRGIATSAAYATTAFALFD